MMKPSSIGVILCATACALAAALAGCEDRSVRIAYGREPRVQVETLREGAGAPVVEGKRVVLHYTMTLENGKTLIDTRADGQSHSLYVGDGTVIEGLDQGIRGMRLGEIRRIVVPPELGYGRAGHGGGVVPENARLLLEVELAGVN